MVQTEDIVGTLCETGLVLIMNNTDLDKLARRMEKLLAQWQDEVGEYGPVDVEIDWINVGIMENSEVKYLPRVLLSYSVRNY